MIHLKEKSMPIIARVNILVVGGGLGGIIAAVRLAKEGKKVLLIEGGTFLGYELTCWQRPWLVWDDEMREEYAELFPIEREWMAFVEGEIIPLKLDPLKKKLEDVLMASGVQILYGCRPTSKARNNDQWLITIGNKSGRQAVFTDTIIDATENCCMKWVDNGGRNLRMLMKVKSEPMTVSRTIELSYVEKYRSRYEVPEHFELENNLIKVFPGSFSKNHVYIDIPIRVESTLERTLEEDMRIECFARKRSLEVIAYIVNHIDPFRNAKIGLGSLQVKREQGHTPKEAISKGCEIVERLHGEKKDPSGDVFYCYSVPDLKDVSSGERDQMICPESSPINLQSALQYMDINELDDYSYETIEIEKSALPLLAQADIAVAGGGTSGAVAARVAACEGAKTVLMEMNDALGGTGTVGGVHNYWFGRDAGYSKEVDARVSKASADLNTTAKKIYWGDSDVWRIEVKANVLLEMCREAGANVFFDSILVGTLMEDKCVRGTVYATPYGLAAVISKVTIDATGDGDAAAFAGGEYQYGNSRDRMTMWASLGQYKEPSQSQNNFSSTVDVGNLFDYTRFIMTGRRRGGSIHDHASYVAPRESRHILGEMVISLEDQMLLRKYPDTILVAFSNHDIKGLSAADSIYLGLLPPNLEISIPYRCLIPRNIDQLLVIGKAISATHDALPAIRMQKDLHQMGGAAGLAAVMSMKQGVLLRDLHVRELQHRLIEDGSLPSSILPYSYEIQSDLAQAVNGLQGNEKWNWLDMGWLEKAKEVSPIAQICFSNSDEAVPLLLDAWSKAKDEKKDLLSYLLVWHRREEGLADILKKIMTDLNTGALPKRKSPGWESMLAPDHGVIPETLYLIYSISRVNSNKVLCVYDKVVDLLCSGKKDFNDGALCLFNYIHSIAYAAERLVYPEFIALLEKLLELQEFQNSIQTSDCKADVMEERYAYLDLCLSRALARCGKKSGLLRLCSFLADNRSILSGSALDELRIMTKSSLNKDQEKWADLLSKWPENYEPVPWKMTGNS